MSKPANQPKQGKNEARAYAKFLRTSSRKLNLVAAMIRGLSAEKALIDLSFSQRRIAKDVSKVLKAAVTNAENNHNLDVDRLVVAEASVGRTMSMMRFHARGRGRASRVEKPFSRLTIVVREGEPKAKKAKTKKTAGSPQTGGSGKQNRPNKTAKKEA